VGVSEEGSNYGGSIAGITSGKSDGKSQGIRRTPASGEWCLSVCTSWSAQSQAMCIDEMLVLVDGLGDENLIKLPKSEPVISSSSKRSLIRMVTPLIGAQCDHIRVERLSNHWSSMHHCSYHWLITIKHSWLPVCYGSNST